MTLILFDIDGTLLRTNGTGREAMSLTAAQLFNRPDMFDAVSFAGAVDSGVVAMAMRSCGIVPTGRRMGRMRSAYERCLRRKLNVSPGVLCPGVPEVIHAVEGRAKVGLLTGNWEGGARIKLDTHGLGSLFSGCVGAYGSDAAVRNELVPIAYRRAMRRWGRLGRVVVVGDTPADVACARAGAEALEGVDVVAVAVQTGFCSIDDLERSKPDVLLTDLQQGLDEFLAVL